MYTAAARPRSMSRSINFRLIAFLAIVAMPFLWFAYIFINQTLTGGIERGANFAKVDLKSLGYFEFDKDNGTINDVPRKWRELDGQKVQLEGFMWASRAASPRIRDFEFVYNITKCCFSGPPQVQERVFVHVPDNRPPMPLVGDFMRMTGILHVKVVRQDGVVQSIYTLDVQEAEPVT
jgi:hypothetical protein